MLVNSILACLLAAAGVAAAPATYDQRQDGDFNVLADVQNVVLLVAMPSKMSIPSIPPDFFDGLLKTSPKHNEQGLQDRADHNLLEAFVEPSTPYHVEIGGGGDDEGDGRAVEVVIAGRRRLETEAQLDNDEYKLLGATEQCGPDRKRDPVTLMCRALLQSAEDAAVAPAPGPAPTDDNSIKDLGVQPQPTPEVLVIPS